MNDEWLSDENLRGNLTRLSDELTWRKLM